MPQSPDATARDQLAQRVAERRKQLGSFNTLDPRVQALSRSSARHLMPPERRASLPLVLFAILGALALIACAGAATAVVYGSAWLQGALNDPSNTVQSFYSAVQQSDYARAYTYFSGAERAQLSEAAFAGQFGSYDSIDGPIVSYTLGTPRVSAAGAHATMVVTVLRRANPRSTEAHTLVLVKQSGAWQINAIAVTFGGTPPPAQK